MKTCTKCGETKPFEAFGKKLQGLQSYCRPCMSVANAENRRKHIDKRKAAARSHYMKNRDELLAKQKVYYEKNRDARMAYLDRWKKANPTYAGQWYLQNAEQERSRAKRWKTDNLDRARMAEKARRSAKRRIPKWADRALMADIYRYARIMRQHGVNCHVDHAVPLRGKTVCGLHTDANLTVLLAEDNLRKGAKLA